MANAASINLFLIKVAARCNINCTYCYEYNLSDQSWKSKPPRMARETLCQTIYRMKEHIVEHKIKKITVVFHGGEPLLAGKDFFEFAVPYINSELQELCSIAFAMQTNGILIDNSWIALFKSLKVNIGLSIDGYKELNDKYRLDLKGRSTYEGVEKALKLMSTKETEDIMGGTLCVMQPDSDPVELFKWFLSWGRSKVDFLFPHHNHLNKPKQNYNPDHGYGYGLWLTKIFDYWWENDLSHTKIRIFEDIFHLLIGGKNSVESLGLAPIKLVVIQTDGGYEAVDSLKSSFEGAVCTKLNVFEHPVNDIFKHELIGSRLDKFSNLSKTCQECRVVKVCGGGYLPHRFHPDLKFLAPTIYCRDLQFLIEHIECRLLELGDVDIEQRINATLRQELPLSTQTADDKSIVAI